MRTALLLAIALAPASLAAQRGTPDAPQKSGPPPTIAAKTAGMTSMPGLLPLFWDANAGKLYLEIPKLSTDLLYTNSLPYGTGSNDLGLDRGQTAEGRIVRFERSGPKILLVQPNSAFRSSATDPAEQLSVRQSFPESILAGFTVAAESSPTDVLIDATDFFLRDAHGVTETLTRLQQGSYKLDPARSAIDLTGTKAFPKNTEVEAILTFATDTVGGGRRGNNYVADVAPDPHALTLHEHQSFLELPGPGFVPRRFDPRAGYFPTSYRDYSAPLSGELDQQFIIRHRLNKRDPACTKACVAEAPIQYYVDRGAPEPIRTALLEGARWWDDAFQAAGWAPGTFKVDILPADADPMDVRFNIIQWVHRYTRGWSYGAAVADPRTGEIIKGNVTLGSLRGRQDYLIAEALLSPYVQGAKVTPANDPMLAMVLQRIRQLAAHETGHTLGLAHNFAASAFPHPNPDQTISVMDYPHPYITLGKNGVPDLSHAYPVGIGIWDKVAIDYGYRQFGARVNEHEELNKILAASEKTGLLYITDEDARPLGSAHPHAHLWDNGADPTDELTRILGIRQAALTRFGENAIKPGAPMAQLEDTLVPLYLLHRYQTEAAIKEIGGLDYRYHLRGDGQPDARIVADADQQKALTAALKTLSPDTLTLPEPLLQLLPPRPPGLRRTQESFASMTGLTFDPVAAAESAADQTLMLLLNPERADRIFEYHHRGAALSLPGYLDTIYNATWAPEPSGFPGVIQQAVALRTIEAMLTLGANPQASVETRAIVRAKLNEFRTSLTKANTPNALYAASRIHQFLDEPEKFTPAKPIEAPPGMPIGDDEDF